MGSLGRHSAIYGLGLFLTKAVAFVMLPIYTRLLTPADYGVLQLIIMTFEVVTILAGSRIAFGIFHFYHKAEDETRRHRVLSTASVLLAVTYAGAALTTIAAAPAVANLVFGGDQRYVTFVRVAAASMAFEGLSLVPTAFFQLQNRSRTFVLVSLGKLGMQVTLNLIFLLPLGLGVLGVLLSSMITNIVFGTALSVRMLSSIGWRFERAAARGFVRFGLPLVVMQVATFLLTFGDRYFLNRAGGTTEVGLYGLAYQFGFLVVTIGFAPFQRVWDPQRFAVAKQPDKDAIFARVFIYLNVLLVSAALGIALFGGDAIRMIAAAPFHASAAFVPVLAAAYVFQCWGSFLNIGIYITEKTEYFTLANYLAATVALAGYLLLVPMWLAWGAAITTLVSLTVRAWLAHLFSQRLWPVQYRWQPIVRLASLAAAVGLVSALTPELAIAVSLAYHAVLYLIFAALAWTSPILNSEEREAVRSRLARSLRRPPAAA